MKMRAIEGLSIEKSFATELAAQIDYECGFETHRLAASALRDALSLLGMA